jgi:hypothetical protein
MLALRQHTEVLTRSSNMRTAAEYLTRLDLGILVGFTYPRVEPEATGWSGYFSHDPWMLRLSFIAPYDAATQASEIAKSITASIRFKGPSVEVAPRCPTHQSRGEPIKRRFSDQSTPRGAPRFYVPERPLSQAVYFRFGHVADAGIAFPRAAAKDRRESFDLSNNRFTYATTFCSARCHASIRRSALLAKFTLT